MPEKLPEQTTDYMGMNTHPAAHNIRFVEIVSLLTSIILWNSFTFNINTVDTIRITTEKHAQSIKTQTTYKIYIHIYNNFLRIRPNISQKYTIHKLMYYTKT